MTEEEWLAAIDQTPMIEYCEGTISERKRRLVIACCFKRIMLFIETGEDLLELARSAAYIGEQFADGDHSQHDFEQARNRIDLYRRGALDDIEWSVEEAIRAMLSTDPAYAINGVSFSLDAVTLLTEKYHSSQALSRALEKVVQTGLIRDIVGNPFRLMTADPSWLTPTVLSLASQMYESRDFAPMPILGDALQDAGCDDDAVLFHCRQPSEHVRGCWVVDLILGKS